VLHAAAFHDAAGAAAACANGQAHPVHNALNINTFKVCPPVQAQ
jgi:hypothetical protein